MTAVPLVDRAASRLVAALEHAWTAIPSQHPEVPEVVIVVASGRDPSAGGSTNCLTAPGATSPEQAPSLCIHG